MMLESFTGKSDCGRVGRVDDSMCVMTSSGAAVVRSDKSSSAGTSHVTTTCPDRQQSYGPLPNPCGSLGWVVQRSCVGADELSASSASSCSSSASGRGPEN